MFSDNVIRLRTLMGYSQEEVAEKIGISRQAYAKWERGDTTPDIEKCAQLAKMYDTTIDALYYTDSLPDGTPIMPAPKGKHIFGVVTMNEKGQIVIPKKAREIMGYGTSEELLILGDEESGLAIMKARDFERKMQQALNTIQNAREEK